jgi:uncharacterized protein (DUF2147 family)
MDGKVRVAERVLLFCLAYDSDWVKAGVTHSTVQHLLITNPGGTAQAEWRGFSAIKPLCDKPYRCTQTLSYYDRLSVRINYGMTAAIAPMEQPAL